MLLSLVLHMYSMRYLLPSVVLLGSAPTYVLAWGVWRLLSALLPARIYQAVDDRLYWVYQSTVLFFFENYTGVQMYLVIFPEGTRYNPGQTKLLSASQTFAVQQGIYPKDLKSAYYSDTATSMFIAAQFTIGLPVLKYVLTPRIKATYVAFDSMKNYLDAIYDVTVVYQGKDNKGEREESPSMTEFLCKECPTIHIHIARIDKKDVPEEQEYMRRWLHERFEIKDKLLIEFFDSPDPERRNKFPGKCVHSKLSLKKTLPSLLILSGLTAGMLTTEAGRKLYVNTWLYGTLLGCLWVTIRA
ncbi:1-acyl-sn-glycerol-3-phosphate acyltransferase epsilon isoform X4 [Marmota monax]|uniref:1-acyl-sn-glycerol-3-phosphate acyltransferase epsilon isoform X4 n=1 Tax=Marmota monax TaxID=9995 RepID=UPI0026F24A74|nr:1-acyl-sn-glycerol-3-phosphate acyltransferase epsilon isoform X4 [Marmota monax]